MTQSDDLVALEQRFWTAAGDPDFYRAHFAEDGRCVFGVGILDKAATVNSMDGATEWADVDMRDVEVIHLDDGVAAVVYSARARDADGQLYEANVSSVYVRRDGDWSLALHHQAPCP